MFPQYTFPSDGTLKYSPAATVSDENPSIPNSQTALAVSPTSNSQLAHALGSSQGGSWPCFQQMSQDVKHFFHKTKGMLTISTLCEQVYFFFLHLTSYNWFSEKVTRPMQTPRKKSTGSSLQPQVTAVWDAIWRASIKWNISMCVCRMGGLSCSRRWGRRAALTRILVTAAAGRTQHSHRVSYWNLLSTSLSPTIRYVLCCWKITYLIVHIAVNQYHRVSRVLWLPSLASGGLARKGHSSPHESSRGHYYCVAIGLKHKLAVCTATFFKSIMQLIQFSGSCGSNQLHRWCLVRQQSSFVLCRNCSLAWMGQCHMTAPTQTSTDWVSSCLWQPQWKDIGRYWIASARPCWHHS